MTRIRNSRVLVVCLSWALVGVVAVLLSPLVLPVSAEDTSFVPGVTSQCELGAKCMAVGWGAGYDWNTLPQPPARTDFVAVAQGMDFGMALTRDKYIMAWKDPTFTDYGGSNVPVELQGQGQTPVKVKQIIGTNFAGLALSEAGRVYAWGSDTIVAGLPSGMQSDGAITKLCYGGNSETACGLYTTGVVECWGNYQQFIELPSLITNLWCGGVQLVMQRADGRYQWSTLQTGETWLIIAPSPPTAFDFIPIKDISCAWLSIFVLFANGTTFLMNTLGNPNLITDGYTMGQPAASIGSSQFSLSWTLPGTQQLKLSAKGISSGGSLFDVFVTNVPQSMPVVAFSTRNDAGLALIQTGCSVIQPSGSSPGNAPPPTISTVLANDQVTVTVNGGFYGAENFNIEYRNYRVFFMGQDITSTWTFLRTGPTLPANSPGNMTCTVADSYSISWSTASALSWQITTNSTAQTYSANVSVVWTDMTDAGFNRTGTVESVFQVVFPMQAQVNSTRSTIDVNNRTDSLVIMSYGLRTDFNVSTANIVDITFSIQEPYPIQNVAISGTAPGAWTWTDEYSMFGAVFPICHIITVTAGDACNAQLPISWTIPAGVCNVGGTYTQTFRKQCFSTWTTAPDPVTGGTLPCPAPTMEWTFTYKLPSINWCATALNRTIGGTSANMTTSVTEIVLGQPVSSSITVTTLQTKFVAAQITSAFVKKNDVTQADAWYNRTLISNGVATALGTSLTVAGTWNFSTATSVSSATLALYFLSKVGTLSTDSLVNNATDRGKRVQFTLTVVVQVQYFPTLPPPSPPAQPGRRVLGRKAEEKEGENKEFVVERTFAILFGEIAGSGKEKVAEVKVHEENMWDSGWHAANSGLPPKGQEEEGFDELKDEPEAVDFTSISDSLTVIISEPITTKSKSSNIPTTIAGFLFLVTGLRLLWVLVRRKRRRWGVLADYDAMGGSETSGSLDMEDAEFGTRGRSDGDDEV